MRIYISLIINRFSSNYPNKCLGLLADNHKIHIEKFRGFHDVSFDLGENITGICILDYRKKDIIIFMTMNEGFPIRKVQSLSGNKRPNCSICLWIKNY